jgi:hypothetical protein
MGLKNNSVPIYIRLSHELSPKKHVFGKIQDPIYLGSTVR